MNGVWKNPYDVKEVFAIAPSVAQYSGKAINVKLPSNLWFSNQTTVQNLYIDFDDGNGYQLTGLGQSKKVQYTTTGEKEWKYKLQLSNGQYKYAHSSIVINEAPVTTLDKFPKKITKGEPEPLGQLGACITDDNGRSICNIQADEAYQGVLGRAYVTIDYITGNTTITNPLIVAEGFDVGHILMPEAQFGLNDIDIFMRDVRDETFQESRLRQFLDGNNQEYDIIYVDWQNGTDFMQRNAYVLEAVIKWVNDEKTTTNQNVVLGQSMGGVIARYALKDMENKNIDHDTRLYISHDAPHQGANVPVSAQQAYQHLVNWYYSTNIDNWVMPLYNVGLDLDAALNLSERPAAQQMLINFVNDNMVVNNTVHDTWQNELELMGYPEETDNNIAVSNGSECGFTQDFNPGDELFAVNGNAKPSVLLSVISRFFNLFIPFTDITSIGAALLFNDTAPLISLLPGGRTTYEVEFLGKAYPLNQTTRIYHGKISIKKKVLWFIPVETHLTNESGFSESTKLPYDYYHGGELDTSFATLMLGNINMENLLGSVNIDLQSQNSFDFVPTPSSLDIGQGSTTLTHPNYLRAYSGGEPPTGNLSTPFDAFITAFEQNNGNEQHIAITARNGNFMAMYMQDINIIDFDCSDFCGDLEIEGNDIVCNSSIFTLDSDIQANWFLINNNNLASLSVNGNQVTVNRNNPNQSGVVTLNAVITRANCGNFTITKEITIGSPRPSGFDHVIVDPYMGRIIASVLPVDGATSYNWYLNGTLQPGNYANNRLQIQRNNCTVRDYQISVKAVNACGESLGLVGLFDNPCYEDDYYRIATNPATDNLTILRNAQEPSTFRNAQNSDNHLYQLFDFSNNMVLNGVLSNETNIDVSHLTSGNYVIKIMLSNEEEEIHHIMIR